MNAMRLLRIVGVILLLALSAAVAAISLIDPNNYKDQIAAQVERKTGRDVTLHGTLELSLLPRIVVRSGSFALSDRADFARDDASMLAAANAEYEIGWLALLRGGWRAGAVTLQRPQVRFIRRADGVTNWDGLIANQSRSDVSPAAALFAGLAVRDVFIESGNLRWRDRVAGRDIRLSNLQFGGGRIASDAPSHFLLRGGVEHNALPMQVQVAATSAARLNAHGDTIVFDRTQITTRGRHRLRDDSFAPIATEFNAAQIAYTINNGALTAHGDGMIRVAATVADFDFAFADDRITLRDLRVRGENGKPLVTIDQLILPFRARSDGYAFQPEQFAALNAATLRRSWHRIVTAFRELADVLEIE